MSEMDGNIQCCKETNKQNIQTNHKIAHDFNMANFNWSLTVNVILACVKNFKEAKIKP